MSMTHCDSCSRRIDPDYDADCYDIKGKCLCAWCREEQLEESMPIRLTPNQTRD